MERVFSAFWLSVIVLIVMICITLVVIGIGTSIWAFFVWDASIYYVVLSYLNLAENIAARIALFILAFSSSIVGWVLSGIDD